jgi:hypothetical protein
MMHHHRARTQTQPQHPRTVAARRPCLARDPDRQAEYHQQRTMVERSIAWLTRNNREIRYGDPSKRSLAHHCGPDPHRHQLGRRLTTVAFTAVRSAARGAPTLTPVISRLLADQEPIGKQNPPGRGRRNSPNDSRAMNRAHRDGAIGNRIHPRHRSPRLSSQTPTAHGEHPVETSQQSRTRDNDRYP